MTEYPILFFHKRTSAAREIPKGFPVASPHIPSTHRQARRIGPKLDELHRVFNTQRAEISKDTIGVSPENVIVLETIGNVDNFLNACNNIEGLEWLSDVDEVDIEPDEDFYDEKNKEKLLSGRLFLSMANQCALQTLISLWKRYSDNPDADLGYRRNSWKNIFKYLYDIRRWSVQDRIKETCFLENLQFRLDHKEEHLPFEIELWYRRSQTSREFAERQLRVIVEAEGGTVRNISAIEEIRYHALLVDVPASTARNILSNLEDIKLIKCEQVMFFRPVGQSVSFSTNAESQPVPLIKDDYLPYMTDPVIALFDGYPLVKHVGLEERLLIDDPMGWGNYYSAADCKHGTSMASLILNDDINSVGSSLKRPLYVRPIMKPRLNVLKGETEEYIPDDVLLTDLIHICVRRLFEGDNGEAPVAPTIRIINLSIADPARPFIRYLSSTARLLDWLSYKYNVLFCVSAGNHTQDLDISVSEGSGSDELERKTLTAIEEDVRNRRLLSPAESINALTVGALHHDHSGVYIKDRRVDLLSTPGLASPISARGSGFNRSVKPEVLFPGGRQLFLAPVIGSQYKIAEIDKAPGQLVACPGVNLDRATYTRGTSNATALATRGAARCYNLLEELAAMYGIGNIADKYIPSLLKAMIVHSSRWDKEAEKSLSILKTHYNSRIFKNIISKHLGYGSTNIDRVLVCTEERATVLGYGELEQDRAHIYNLPLPAGLSGTTLWRGLAITLAWITPINVEHRKYRQAHLRFTPPLDELGVRRTEADWRAVQRGTVQHEVMSGNKALDFLDGEELFIRVECRADAASKISGGIPYAIAVTLEMEEGVPVSVYQEIRQKLGVAVHIKPQV